MEITNFNLYTLCTGRVVRSPDLRLKLTNPSFEGFTQPPTTYLLFFPFPVLDLVVLVDFLVCLAGVLPSSSATSSSVLLLFCTPDLPGPPGCFFPVTSLLNGVPWHWKSLLHPVCDAFRPLIYSYRTKYMKAAIVLVWSVALE